MGQLRLERVDDLDAVRDEWSALAARAGNPFLTWEWVSTWWKHFGRDNELHVLRAVDGERTAGFLPLYVMSGGLGRQARLIGHGLTPFGGAVAAPEDVAAVSALIGPGLKPLIRADVLVADVPASADWVGDLRGMRMYRVPSPTIRFEGRDWETFLAACSKNLRRQIRNYENRLCRDHEIVYRRTTDAAALDADFAIHQRLHELRWEQEETESEAFVDGRDAFHREWMGIALDRGWLVLRIMELDGRPVASEYTFRFGGVEWSFQTGRDPEFERERVGFVLLNHAIREACHDEMGEFNLLAGGQEYKLRLASADPGVARLVIGTSRRGCAAVAAGRHVKPALGRVRDRSYAVASRGVGELPSHAVVALASI